MASAASHAGVLVQQGFPSCKAISFKSTAHHACFRSLLSGSWPHVGSLWVKQFPPHPSRRPFYRFFGVHLSDAHLHRPQGHWGLLLLLIYPLQLDRHPPLLHAVLLHTSRLLTRARLCPGRFDGVAQCVPGVVCWFAYGLFLPLDNALDSCNCLSTPSPHVLYNHLAGNRRISPLTLSLSLPLRAYHQAFYSRC